jgi:hypothetical protein
MEVGTDNREKSDRANNELLETAGDDKALVLDTVQKPEPEIEAPMDLEESIQPIHADEVAHSLDSLVNSFESGISSFISGTRALIAERDELLAASKLFALDAAELRIELDKAKAEIEQLKTSHAIANKRETIAVLKHVQGFVKPINEDFDLVLGDIVQKIEAMPEAA